MYDLVIRNARIVDGTGKPAYEGSIAVEDGVIRGVGNAMGQAARFINADGRVVSPGFIDAHTHMDLFLKMYPAGLPVINYGVTTVVIGDCGASCAPVPPKGEPLDILVAYLRRVLDKYVDPADFEWSTYPEYLDYLEGRVGVNVASLMPHSPVRLVVMREEAMKRAATPDEVESMLEIVKEGWDAGAIGFSSSPLGGPLIHANTPSAFADLDELVTIGRRVTDWGGRYQLNGARGIAEPESMIYAVTQAVKARYIFNEWRHYTEEPELVGKMHEALELLNRQGSAAYGVVIPYTHVSRCGATDFLPFAGLQPWEAIPKEPHAFATALADPDTRARIRDAAAGHLPAQRWDSIVIRDVTADVDRRWIGKDVATVARTTAHRPIDFALDLLARNAEGARFVCWGHRANSNDDLLSGMITSPWSVIGTDAGAHVESFFFYGAPARLLGHWSRNRELLPLEAAVHKVTGFQSQALGTKRGILGEGRPADLVMFDPAAIGDNLTGPLPPDIIDRDELERPAPGIDMVVVNGKVAVEDGVVTDERAGKVRRWEL